MIEAVVVLVRGLQYLLASLTFGLAAFVVLNRAFLDEAGLSQLRRWVGWAATVQIVVVPGALFAQTALMAGAWASALDPQILLSVATGMGLGAALLARWAAATAGGLLFWSGVRGRGFWFPAVLLGLAGVLTFAWTGHGGATEGAGRVLHQTSTAIHAVAGTFWVGALAAFVWLVFRRVEPGSKAERDAASMLVAFAGSGTIAVATLVFTGLINAAFLVGVSRVPFPLQSPYGGLLVLKLILFVAMLALAALHRSRLAPQLEAGADGALGRLRLSVMAEFACGGLVLGLVAVLGILPPPVSM
ncbi:copper homeostasis membrane protein CopD [Brevundimonas sp.]|uniref:copper homeostasis membrane protein CopD n=1 Tax=Brevundimonas sp. TaxID=1871086 RepID=UPI0035ADCEE8